MSTAPAEKQPGEQEVDFTSPEYILQNIRYQGNFESFDNFSSETRSRVIQNICDQVCFYIGCVLKSFRDVERAPTIWIYGAGFLGSCIIDSLCECGCKPLLKIFARDEMVIQSWKEKGIKAATKLKEGQFIDIVIICSNLASFSQFCRDMSDFVSPKTCIISTSFGLQRSRLFNIMRTPGIFRTYVENKAPEYDADAEMDATPYYPPHPQSPHAGAQRKSLTSELVAGEGRRLSNPSSPGKGGGPTANPFAPTRPSRTPKWSPSPSPASGFRPGNGGGHVSPTRQVGAATEDDKKDPLVPLSEMEVSARFLASRKNAVRNLIILLENYYILSGMPATTARTEALAAVVGAEAVQPVDRPTSTTNGTDDESAASISSDRSASEQSSAQRRASQEMLKSSEEEPPSQASILISSAMRKLHKKYGKHFHVELSKHILVLDLPRISDLPDGSPLGSPMARVRKNPRNRIGRTPTRGVIGAPLSNWESRFLGDSKLIDIFKLDSQSSYLNDEKNSYLDELDAESDEEDAKRKEVSTAERRTLHPAACTPVAPPNMERFYILRYDSNTFASEGTGLHHLKKPTFRDVVGNGN